MTLKAGGGPDVAIGPDGTLQAAFADNCFDGSCENLNEADAQDARGLVGWLPGLHR